MKAQREEIEAIKESRRVIDVAHSLSLEGRMGRFFCPACQHRDSSAPALAIYRDGFNCFKCQTRGDVISLVMLAHDCSFKEALNWLLDLSPSSTPILCRPERELPARHEEILSAFISKCRAPTLKEAGFFRSRLISFDLVLAAGIRVVEPHQYWRTCKELYFSFGDESSAAGFGLDKGSRNVFSFFAAQEQSFFVFPYTFSGRVTQVKARPISKVENGPRFLNGRGGFRQPYLVGNPESPRAVICEGETDSLLAASLGFFALGCPGAGHFRPEWIKLLKHKTVRIAFDSDGAGQEGARRIMGLFREAGENYPTNTHLPKGLDLVSYAKRHSASSLKQVLAG